MGASEAGCIAVGAARVAVGAARVAVSAPDHGVSTPEFRVAAPEFSVAAPELSVAAPELRVAALELRVTALELRVAALELRVVALELRVVALEFLVAAQDSHVDAPESRACASNADGGAMIHAGTEPIQAHGATFAGISAALAGDSLPQQVASTIHETVSLSLLPAGPSLHVDRATIATGVATRASRAAAGASERPPIGSCMGVHRLAGDGQYPSPLQRMRLR